MITITLYDVIQSELIEAGHNEFKHNGEWVYFDEDYQFIQKMLNYDGDVEEIVNKTIFKFSHLNEQEHDRYFKKMFLSRFLDREINAQTLEGFVSKLQYVFMTNRKLLNEVFENFDRYVKQESTQKTESLDGNLSDTRSIMSSLPQTEINLNLSDDTMDYADSNNISKTKSDNQSESNTEQGQYNLETLMTINTIVDGVMNEIDKRCFLQIW